MGTADTSSTDSLSLAQKIALEIENESERQVVARLGYTPAVWYTGGPNHNDDRLRAEVREDGTISVDDGATYEIYGGDMGGVADYVSDWLDMLWCG